MDWTTPVDIYCERMGPDFWAEPLNAVSNLAFVLAAFWGWATARRMDRLTPMVTLLLVMAASIGVGSFLFHTFANSWSELADVIPIWSFVAVFVLVAIHVIGGVAPARVLRIALIAAAVIVIVFLALPGGTAGDGAGPGLLNGSEQYAPAVLALFVFAALTQIRRHPVRHWVAAGTLAFCLSLVLRTLDLHLCATIPFGTHFLWHILNGAMIALLLQALIRALDFQSAAH